MALFIPADLNQPIVQMQPKNGINLSLEELQKAVGGYIELVSTIDDRIMVINEEGKLNKAPKNERANQLIQFISPDVLKEYLKNNPSIIFVGDPNESDYIVGDVVVLTKDENM